MSSGSDPRFRIRMEDGSEIAVPTLEALARRLDRGEVMPDTELFDAGTNAWTPARKAAVVRFILEERELEGLPPLEDWEGVFEEPEAVEEPEGEGETEQAEAVEEAEQAEEPESVEGAEAVEGPEAAEGSEVAGDAEQQADAADPFAMDLTLEPEPSRDTEADDPSPAAEAGSGASDFEGFTLGEDFGAVVEEPEEKATPPAGPSPAAGASDDLPLMEFPDDRGDETADTGPQGGTSLDEWARDTPSAPPGPGAPGEPLLGPVSGPPSRPPVRRPERKPPAPAPASRPGRAPSRTPSRPPGRGRRAAGILVLLGILAGGGYLYQDRLLELWDVYGPGAGAAVDGDGSTPGLMGEDLGGAAYIPSVPAGLEAPVDRGLAQVRVRFNTVVDSLRGVHGMADAPPREWLSGYYLANASQFPGVRAFWEGYIELVGELRERDPELFLRTAQQAGSVADPERNEALERYLDDRYRSILSLRRERYAQLAQVARRAVELHDFLVASESAIRFTPTVGPEVPVDDPIMEARSDDPEVQSELLRRMDAIFQALDRSRGGDAPGMGGLGNDLFRRFGEG